MDTPALRARHSVRRVSINRMTTGLKMLWGAALLAGCTEPEPPPAKGTTPAADHSSDSAEIKRLRELGVQNLPQPAAGAPLTNDSITQLFLGATRFSAADVDLLSSFPNLEVLILANKRDLTDDTLEKIAALTHLKKLNLNGVPITDAGLAHLAHLTDLEELWLIATKITDDGLAHLTGFTKLKTLSIEATEATDKGVEHLKQLEGLRVFHFKNSKITDDGLNELKAALPDCLIVK